MLGGVLGLVISVGIILLTVLLDNKIHTEDDVAKYLDLAVVGVIPNIREVKRNEQGKQKTPAIANCILSAVTHRSSMWGLPNPCVPTSSSCLPPATARLS